MSDELIPSPDDPAKGRGIDINKFKTPVTRGELYLVIQKLRGMIYNSSAMSSQYSVGNRVEAGASFKTLKEADGELQNMLDDLIRVDKSDG